MRAALGVFGAGQDRRVNLARMTGLCDQAAGHGADLVVFCEAAVTGFVGNDDPRHDLDLGEPVPGPATKALGATARRLGLWIGFGLFERANGVLYDSAVLLDRQGQLRQVYRRIDPHWHRPDAHPGIYRQGTQPVAVSADFGVVSMLICGDLFNDGVLGQLSQLRPDVVVIPMARGFDADVADDAQWRDREQGIYASQIQRIGAGAVGLLANQLGASRVRPRASAAPWPSPRLARRWRHGPCTPRDSCWRICHP
jgi:predicted amidohydrolase